MQITLTNRNFELLGNYMYVCVDSFQTVNHVSKACIAISSFAHYFEAWFLHCSVRTLVYKVKL